MYVKSQTYFEFISLTITKWNMYCEQSVLIQVPTIHNWNLGSRFHSWEWISYLPCSPVEHLRNCHEMKLLITPGRWCTKYMVYVGSLMTNLRFMENKATRSPDISRKQVQKLTPQFLLYIYILDIDSHCPYLLSGEPTFQLTSCSNSLHVYLRFGETTSPI